MFFFSEKNNSMGNISKKNKKRNSKRVACYICNVVLAILCIMRQHTFDSAFSVTNRQKFNENQTQTLMPRLP